MESSAVVGKFGKQARLHKIRKVESKKNKKRVPKLPLVFWYSCCEPGSERDREEIVCV